MEDAGLCATRAAEALRKAEEEPLPNARLKHLAAAEAWQAMADRFHRVKAATERNEAAKNG